MDEADEYVEKTKETRLVDDDYRRAQRGAKPQEWCKSWTFTLLTLLWAKMALYVASAYYANQIPKIGSLPARTEMYKEPISDWSMPAWVDFDWSQGDVCESGWEPIGHYALLSDRSSNLT